MRRTAVTAVFASAVLVAAGLFTVGGSGTAPVEAVAPESDPYLAALQAVPGLTHYYPLDADNQARDVVGAAHGTVKGTGVTFGATDASFTGTGYIELPDHDDFSVATRGGLTVLVDVTVTNWRGAGASEYVHWMGKGVSGAHEWAFRHYVDGGTGEAPQRQGRMSFYHFNPAGGLGAGSYYQDAEDTTEHHVAAATNLSQIQLFKDGRLRDTDPLSGFSIRPANTTTPVRIGTRDMSSGFLVGRVRRVAFFNRVLTAAEVARLNEANTAPAPSSSSTPTASPTDTAGGVTLQPGDRYTVSCGDATP